MSSLCSETPQTEVVFSAVDPSKDIRNSFAMHKRTFGVYNAWRAMMKRNMGGVFDWANVAESAM